MTDNEARYEFRAWGEDLSAVRKRLDQRAAPVESHCSETYLLSNATDQCNAKIRNELLDIKLLVDMYRGLERWQPTLKTPFPISAETLTENLFPALNLISPALLRAQYGLTEFVDEVVRPHPSLAVAEIAKTRFRFNLQNCLAEFVQVLLNAGEHQTVALEAVDANRVLSLIDEIGLRDAENLNYVRYLKRLLVF